MQHYGGMVSMKGHTKDKRAVARFPYCRPATFTVMGNADHPPDTVRVSGKIVNLGSGGLGLETRGEAISAGAVLQAWIPMAEVPVTVPVLTEVRWAREAQPGLYQAGLRFLL